MNLPGFKPYISGSLRLCNRTAKSHPKKQRPNKSLYVCYAILHKNIQTAIRIEKRPRTEPRIIPIWLG